MALTLRSVSTADERDAIQKKTFSKWINKYLVKSLRKPSRIVRDLFEDLRDGDALLTLLEILSGEHLPRERGRMRVHMLQNAQIALNFLKFKKIKLVNIRPDDVVDGNPKLTLGLIWTIILHYQVRQLSFIHQSLLLSSLKSFRSDSSPDFKVTLLFFNSLSRFIHTNRVFILFVNSVNEFFLFSRESL